MPTRREGLRPEATPARRLDARLTNYRSERQKRLHLKCERFLFQCREHWRVCIFIPP